MTANVLNAQTLLDEAVAFYDGSHDANGLPVRILADRHREHADELSPWIRELQADGRLEVVFAEAEINPHIRRIPRAWRKPFDELITKYDLQNACVYPSPQVIAERIDLSKWNDHPYTLRLWQGASHLDLVHFDLAVLERYRNDPRYRYTQSFFGGSISIRDEHYLSEDFPERDKVLVQRFGIGYDQKKHRVVTVMLSDLRDLSSEHQKAWASFERSDPCTLNEGSYNSWFLGEWSEFGSIFEAIPEEISVINEMAVAAFGEPLFRKGFRDDAPAAYGVLLRPTQREFLDFARALDLMLAENLNVDFFPRWIGRTITVQRKDGTAVEESKGSIKMLEEWISRSFRTDDGNPSQEVGTAFRKVRRLRTDASHSNICDVFDVTFEEKQRELVIEAYGAVKSLRLILANHPSASAVKVPDWLFEGEIRIP